LRIDPLSGDMTIVADERSRRPGGAPSLSPQQLEPVVLERDSDPFAEGNEQRTPPELYAVRPRGGGANSPGWTVRVVENLYPALVRGEGRASPGPRGREGAEELFHERPAVGAHEVIVSGPQSVRA